MTYEELLKRMIEARKKAKISQRQMAGILGRSAEYVYLLENQKVPMRVQDYLTICEVLHISPFEMMKQEQESKARLALYEQIKGLSERDFQILKGLILLMSMNEENP